MKNITDKNSLLLYFFLFTFHFSLLSAQVVFVPINDNIYSYLDRMNIKGIIQLDSEVKPFSKMYIAEKLLEVDSKANSKQLTNVDIELLDFYSSEYGTEINKLIKNQKFAPTSHQSPVIDAIFQRKHSNIPFPISAKDSSQNNFSIADAQSLNYKDTISGFPHFQSSTIPPPFPDSFPHPDKSGQVVSRSMSPDSFTFASKDLYGSYRLISYEDSLFSFKLSPIMAYSVSSTGGKSGHQRTGGVRTEIMASNWFGASLNMTDNGEFSENIDRKRYLTPKRGADFIGATNGIEFSDVRAQINFNWGWGTVSLKKDYSEWGNSYFGNVILSDKSPSYPHFYMELKPVNWFRFYYQFGWLHSGVIDSSRTIVINSSEDFYVAHERFVKKYFTINMMTVTPWDIFDISIGNAAIYAGDMRPEMFIPFNFYKYMDRDTGKKSVEDSNGMFFFDMALRYPETFKFYASIFVDVTSIREIFNNEFYSTWTGATIGGKKTDIFLDNLDLTIEYTKITPWVYEHKYGDLTNYKHLGYSLGHWIGQNADQFKIQFNYQPIRGLRTQVYTEFVRKGGLKEIDVVYNNREDLKFLYSPVRSDFYLGVDANYEIFHELFVEGSYRYSNISDEDEIRTEDFMLGSQNYFSLGFRYGTP